MFLTPSFEIPYQLPFKHLSLKQCLFSPHQLYTVKDKVFQCMQSLEFHVKPTEAPIVHLSKFLKKKYFFIGWQQSIFNQFLFMWQINLLLLRQYQIISKQILFLKIIMSELTTKYFSSNNQQFKEMHSRSSSMFSRNPIGIVEDERIKVMKCIKAFQKEFIETNKQSKKQQPGKNNTKQQKNKDIKKILEEQRRQTKNILEQIERKFQVNLKDRGRGRVSSTSTDLMRKIDEKCQNITKIFESFPKFRTEENE